MFSVFAARRHLITPYVNNNILMCTSNFPDQIFVPNKTTPMACYAHDCRAGGTRRGVGLSSPCARRHGATRRFFPRGLLVDSENILFFFLEGTPSTTPSPSPTPRQLFMTKLSMNTILK